MWNRVTALMVMITASILLLTPIEVEARRGGGGGRGGGGRSGGATRSGGAYRGGNTMNRTPTMSRASSRSTHSQPRQLPQNRDASFKTRQQIETKFSTSQAKVQQSREAVQQRPSAANRAELRNQVNRYAQNRPKQNIDRQALGQKAQNFSSQRGNQIVQNKQLSDRVSQGLQQSRPGFGQWFDRNFFDRHDIDLDYVGNGTNWWRPAAWATLTAWGVWNWSTPYYYDDSGDAYPLNATESIDTHPYNTTMTYSQPNAQPDQNTQTPVSTDEDWLPLGVFAVANNANVAIYANRFIQLAINRSGEIAGVLYNSKTDTAQDLTGVVDPDSQKVYLSLDNRTDSPIASTGIYNLTEDQTPINVHFSDGSEQTWTLVRLQQE